MSVESVSEEVIENAVLQMFVDCGIAAGDSLPFRRLRTDWPKTKLRRSELIGGIKRLMFRGDLELEDDHEGGLFILTTQGQRRAQALPPAPRTTWNEFFARTLEKFTPQRQASRKKERRHPELPLRHG